MVRKIQVGGIEVEVEDAKASTYSKGNAQYARVCKFVPREWLNSDVVIVKKDDFDKIARYVNNLITMMATYLADEAKKMELINEIKTVKISNKPSTKR